MILDREEIFDPSFANERTVREDADPIANFLHLREQMRGEQHRDAAPFQVEDEIVDLARPDGIDARGRFIENDELAVPE